MTPWAEIFSGISTAGVVGIFAWIVKIEQRLTRLETLWNTRIKCLTRGTICPQ